MHDSVWHGPAKAVVRGALLFPGHASLWFADNQWGGTLVIDAFAPISPAHDIELQVRGDRRRRQVAIAEISTQAGIQVETATTIRFQGLGEPPATIWS